VHSIESTQTGKVQSDRAACALEEALDRLARNPVCGYHHDGPPATEPTALAAMALLADERRSAAGEALNWLAGIQSDEGSLGINAEHQAPCWPTGWAVLAWQLAVGSFERTASADPHNDPASGTADPWRVSAERAVDWLRSMYGRRGEPTPIVGHNTQLRGWPWVDTTHSWVEPTAISVLALKAAGLAGGPRVREAVALLLDRMIPSGGWNQSNKIILGSVLRPHVQPTGLALAALHGETQAGRHAIRSIEYLKRMVSARTATASLSYAVLGAAAHGVKLPSIDRYLAAAACRTLEGDGSPYKLALLGLAAKGDDCPWFKVV
jgi:hypothetical protein